MNIWELSVKIKGEDMYSKILRKFTTLIFIVSVLSSFIISHHISLANENSLDSLSLRMVRQGQGQLGYLLEFFTSEKIASLKNQGKFVVHSGSSGVGQGTIKERMLELYPDKFQRFLLYATRERRGLEVQSSDPRYTALRTYYDSSDTGVELTRELVESEIPDSVSEDDRNELLNVLFPNWDEVLTGAPREDIPSFNERVELLENGNIKVYKEFNGVHYWFVSQDELFRLQDEEGIIIEPVREHYQGLDITEISRSFERGSDKILILEGARIWFDHVSSNFENVTSIFIAPISEQKLKDKMKQQLGDKYAEIIERTNVLGLLKGGIEKYVTIELPQLIEDIPADLTIEESDAFLNIKNAILASVGYKILHSDTDAREWLSLTGLVKEDDLRKISEKLDIPFNLDSVVEIVNDVYANISSDMLVSTAIGVVINEIASRIENRVTSQGGNPQDVSVVGNTYIRASQSPREYGSSSDYSEVLVNTWGELDASANNLAELILRRLHENIGQ